jgi:hypothetical protein
MDNDKFCEVFTPNKKTGIDIPCTGIGHIEYTFQNGYKINICDFHQEIFNLYPVKFNDGTKPLDI